MTNNKPREFWIDPYDHSREVPIRHRELPGVVHVIEHSAYAALEAKYSKAVEALRAAPKGNMSLVYWDKWLALKEQTLASLGESEVGEG